MFAVIKTGGKQYSVKADDRIRVEKLAGEPGDMVEISEVLMVGDAIGMPLVEGALVTAEIVEHGRARKVIAFKKRRRQNSRRKIGHRQHWTEIAISEILTDGKKPSKKAQGLGKAKAKGKAAAADTPTARDAKGQANEADRHLDTEEQAKPAKAEKKGDKKADAKADKKDAPAAGQPLFAAPADGAQDKLTDIKGIGPVAEGQLKEQGITTFKQIAELSDADIERVDEYMPFSAAQIRDWQEQAKEKVKG